jgi:hypothetical protein
MSNRTRYKVKLLAATLCGMVAIQDLLQWHETDRWVWLALACGWAGLLALNLSSAEDVRRQMEPPP